MKLLSKLFGSKKQAPVPAAPPSHTRLDDTAFDALMPEGAMRASFRHRVRISVEIEAPYKVPSAFAIATQVEVRSDGLYVAPDGEMGALEKGVYHTMAPANSLAPFQLGFSQMEKLEGVIQKKEDGIWCFKGVLGRAHSQKQLLPDYNVETRVTYNNTAKGTRLLIYISAYNEADELAPDDGLALFSQMITPWQNRSAR